MINSFEFTADEAMQTVSEVLDIVTVPVPEDYQARMAAFMLIIGDICKGTCTCDSCIRTREIFEDV